MILETIKVHQLQARKDRNKPVASLLTTLIGEADTLAKNKCLVLLDDASTVALIQKFINNINIIVDKAGPSELSTLELDVLNAYMPQKLSDEKLTAVLQTHLDALKAAQTPDKQLLGKMLGALKTVYGGQYDGAKASEIAKSLVA